MTTTKKYSYLLILIALVLFIPSQVKAEPDSLSTDYMDSFSVHDLIYSVPGSKSITMENLLKNYLPRLAYGITYSDNIEFKGKLKKDIMPVFTDEMRKMGWNEAVWERKGSTQFFSRAINGQIIKISIIPAERGGPEEENTSTFIYVKIISQNLQR